MSPGVLCARCALLLTALVAYAVLCSAASTSRSSPAAEHTTHSTAADRDIRTCQLRQDTLPLIARKSCATRFVVCLLRRFLPTHDYRVELPVRVLSEPHRPGYDATACLYPNGVYNESYRRALALLAITDPDAPFASGTFVCWESSAMSHPFVSLASPVGMTQSRPPLSSPSAILTFALVALPLILSCLLAFFPADDVADTVSPWERFRRRVVFAHHQNWLRGVQQAHTFEPERPGDAFLPIELLRARNFARERRRAERLTREQSGWLCDRLYVGKNPRDLQNDELSWSCTICLEGTGPSADPSLAGGGCAQVPCGHQFHKRCLRRWLRRGKACCPLCNFSVKDIASEMPPPPLPMETSTMALNFDNLPRLQPAPPEVPPIDLRPAVTVREREVSPIAR